LPPKAYRFRDAQPVAVDQQQQQMVADAMAPLARSCQQLLDLVLIKEVLGLLMGVGGARFHYTLNITPPGRHHLTPENARLHLARLIATLNIIPILLSVRRLTLALLVLSWRPSFGIMDAWTKPPQADLTFTVRAFSYRAW